jgi:hypothetical protein
MKNFNTFSGLDINMKKLFPVVAIGLTVTFVGCDDSTYYRANPASDVPAGDTSSVEVTPDRVDVDIKTDGEPAADRVERRLERRENVRDAVDGVDVDIDAGRTKIDIR